ncbi:MAG: hypothetical protein HY695_07255 [Deltaproteobacteria bacterium]|nr:hypothetical protein [Deltaproteobacteria bacterium]
MTLLTLLFILRIVHDLAAAILVGSVIFSYFLLRPALRLIPPAHAVVVAQRVGNLFTYTGWTALVLLFLSGLLRLYYTGRLGFIFTLGLFAHGPGRSLAIMILFWFFTVVSSTAMTFVLRPKLMKKLTISANPTLADVEKRRATQMTASTWLDRLQLSNVITSTLALIAGAAIAHGGLF